MGRAALPVLEQHRRPCHACQDRSPWCVWGFAEELMSTNMSYNQLRFLLSDYRRNNSYAGLCDPKNVSQGRQVIVPFEYLNF